MEKPSAILITQCLQNDFVRPLAVGEPLPNALHVGASEARRLLGENPAEGPVSRVMEWAYAQAPERLLLIHIRDWHSPGDPVQAPHLEQFGGHCYAESEGAAFAFTVPAERRNNVVEITSLTLNDFQGTALDETLAPLAGAVIPVGIIGVWTEAKVFFLCYELVTRYPRLRPAVCSALSASSSRAQHFMALEQLQRLLGVHVIDSPGEFIEFLGGTAEQRAPSGMHAFPALELADGALAAHDEQLLRYLFRHCRRVRARVLSGGFSGNIVLAAQSTDLHGHEEAVHVVKIGPRGAISKERTAFERIEEVLGNSAPRISDFADFGERGGVKYRYASMSRQGASTFQQQYQAGMPQEKVDGVLATVFVEQLGRLYAAAEVESCDLLGYYCFESRWAPHVRREVERVLGGRAERDCLQLRAGPAVPNPCLFYEEFLPTLDPLHRESVYFAYVHGDLNGANIILDARDNVWLIDFFHTHRGHVLKDLIKLENDLLYIFTPVAEPRVLEQAMQLTDILAGAADLNAELPAWEQVGIDDPVLARSWRTLRTLRSFYPGVIHAEGSVVQWLIGALRYAVHTLSFNEPSTLQKQWALYAAGRYSERIVQCMSPASVP